ncbi:MAG: hypothetical protein NZ899_10770 [Thermoguttaceae bacterium]|nr:hypothetical protein [Thermoguttaceae bacterium]MDW8078951.1 NfeD family protein [Thermoguttaceae bacterium]
MDEWGVWTYLFSVPVILLVFGFLCVVLEVFVPSGGLLGFAAAVFLTAAVVAAFTLYGEGFGVVVLVIIAVMTPAIVVWGLSLWPRTSLGRKMILWPPSPGEPDSAGSRNEANDRLVGMVGLAVTDLRPGGVVSVAGKQFSATCRLGPLAQGTPVVVREVRAGYLVVEPGEMPQADVDREDRPDLPEVCPPVPEGNHQRRNS